MKNTPKVKDPSRNFNRRLSRFAADAEHIAGDLVARAVIQPESATKILDLRRAEIFATGLRVSFAATNKASGDGFAKIAHEIALIRQRIEADPPVTISVKPRSRSARRQMRRTAVNIGDFDHKKDFCANHVNDHQKLRVVKSEYATEIAKWTK